MDPRLGKIAYKIPKLTTRALAGDLSAIAELAFWGGLAALSCLGMKGKYKAVDTNTQKNT